MQTWIALLRGVNVVGNNILPMKELATLLAQLGCRDIRTYIQSGNCVFRSAIKSPTRLAGDISSAIDARFGFRPQVIVLSKDEFEAAIDNNPYPHPEDPKGVHFYFLAAPPRQPNLAALEALATDREAFAHIGRVFYLEAPDGIGRSKLAARIEKHLGVTATGATCAPS